MLVVDVNDFTDERAKAIFLLSRAIVELGFGSTESPGAIEAISMSINGEGGVGQNCLSDSVSLSNEEIANSIVEASNIMAAAIRDAGNAIAKSIALKS